MTIKKENLESIGRRVCSYMGVNPEDVDEASGAPFWMLEAMFVNKMMVANQAVQDELKSLPSVPSPPDQPAVYTPYHDNNN